MNLSNVINKGVVKLDDIPKNLTLLRYIFH